MSEPSHSEIAKVPAGLTCRRRTRLQGSRFPWLRFRFRIPRNTAAGFQIFHGVQNPSGVGRAAEQIGRFTQRFAVGPRPHDDVLFIGTRNNDVLSSGARAQLREDGLSLVVA